MAQERGEACESGRERERKEKGYLEKEADIPTYVYYRGRERQLVNHTCLPFQSAALD